MNESKQRGFLKGTLMEQSMNFYLFISILASSLVQRAGLGNKKNMLPQRNKEGKKKGKRNSIFLSNYQKFIILGLFFNLFLVYFSPWCLMKYKFVSHSDHVQMESDNPQDGHRCGACHNASNAKVNTRKFSDYKSNVMK